VLPVPLPAFGDGFQSADCGQSAGLQGATPIHSTQYHAILGSVATFALQKQPFAILLNLSLLSADLVN